jgi:putative nucleotidyltransferase with HDIG domain
MSRDSYDLDVAVLADAIPRARALADHFGGAFFPLDKERDIGRALLSAGGPQLVVDIGRLRGGDLAGDLVLRDFTINAMAWRLDSGPLTLIDRHGGAQDLQQRLVRAVSERSLRDDPIRILRAVRMVAELGFELDEPTTAWLQRDARLLAEAPLERVQQELVRIMAARGASNHLQLLDSLGALSVVLPEVADLQGVEQSPPHCLGVYEHSLETVRQLEWLLEALEGAASGVSGAMTESRGSRLKGAMRRPLSALLPLVGELRSHLTHATSAGRTRGMMLKWAALLHDVGKPKVRSEEPGGRIRFLRHDVVGARLATLALQRLRFTNAEARWVGTIVRQHLRPAQLSREPVVTRRAVYRFYRDLGEAGVDTCLLSLADHLATWGPELIPERWARRVQTAAQLLEAFFRRHDNALSSEPLVNGRELQDHFGLTEGPRLGSLLEALREAQASGEVVTRDDAFALVRQLLTSDDSPRVG